MANELKPSSSSTIEKLYDYLADDEDARVCKAISDEACREVPGNFFRILISNTASKIGDRVASPKTTLAWLLQSLGAPAFLTGLLVPIRESGSLLPQLAIGAMIRSAPVRKWFWAAGSLVEGLCILGMGLVALTLEGAAAGWALIGLLALFSLARGFCSVAYKDVIGKTIPKTRRGRLKGWMSAASGVLTIVAGGFLLIDAFTNADAESVTGYAILLFVAGGFWIIAAAMFATVREFPGETDGGGNALKQALSRMSLLRDDAPFRRFVIVRALAIGSGMSAPFIVALAHGELGGEAMWLGVFLMADGLAAMVSGPVWGKASDKSSKGVLTAAMGVAGAICLAVVVWSLLDLPEGAHWVFYPAAFFALGIAHSGVRIGRKTYLVDMAEGNKRTDYVAVSNTAIGLILLVAGVVTGGLALLSTQAALVAFMVLAAVGVGLGLRLKDVSG